MAPDKPRFGSGHMCAGCPLSGILHIDCVIDGNVTVHKLPARKPNQQETKLPQPDLPVDEEEPIR